jgi:hypothetical protein
MAPYARDTFSSRLASTKSPTTTTTALFGA